MENLICDLIWIAVIFLVLIISSINSKNECNKVKLKAELKACDKMIKASNDVIKLLKESNQSD